jgi:hypothetical protein
MYVSINKHLVSLDFKLSPWNKCSSLVSGLLRDVRSEFADDVSELPVGPTFTGQRNKNFAFCQWIWDPQGIPKRRQ